MKYIYKIGIGGALNQFWLTVTDAGWIGMRNVKNDEVPNSWLLGEDTAEFDLVVAALTSSDQWKGAEEDWREEQMLKVVKKYHQHYSIERFVPTFE